MSLQAPACILCGVYDCNIRSHAYCTHHAQNTYWKHEPRTLTLAVHRWCHFRQHAVWGTQQGPGQWSKHLLESVSVPRLLHAVIVCHCWSGLLRLCMSWCTYILTLTQLEPHTLICALVPSIWLCIINFDLRNCMINRDLSLFHTGLL